MSRSRWKLGLGSFAVALVAEACASTPSPDVAPPDGEPPNVEPGDGSTQDATCESPDVSDFIYLLAQNVADEKQTLYKFKPAGLTLDAVGVIDCPTPITAMALDRGGTLWITHPAGVVNQTTTAGGSCTLVDGLDIEPSTEYSVVGGAFATLGAGPDEALFTIAMRNSSDPTELRRTGAADQLTAAVASLQPGDSLIASTPGTRIPILTGTGDGRLFGLGLPDGDAGATHLAEIDRTTGRQIGTERSFASEFAGSQNAAFAFFGGAFWLFTSHQATQGTQFLNQLVVTRFDPATGTASVVKTFGDVRPLGAAVSTCAPVLL